MNLIFYLRFLIKTGSLVKVSEISVTGISPPFFLKTRSMNSKKYLSPAQIHRTHAKKRNEQLVPGISETGTNVCTHCRRRQNSSGENRGHSVECTRHKNKASGHKHHRRDQRSDWFFP